MMAKSSPQPQDKYVLRLPNGMRDRIKVAAEANGRSMNAELIAALEEKFPPPTDEDLRRALAVLDDRIERAAPERRGELHDLRGRLTVALYFEEPEA